MRLRHPGGRTVHVSCGTNIQPLRDMAGVLSHLDSYATAVRARLHADTLGVSLWLPPALAAALAIDSRARGRLRAELDARGLEVVTLNGLRYDETPGAKGAQHEPDWSTVERLDYTLDLARVLVDLLPDDAVRGSVCTTGIGRRDTWDAARERAGARILGRLSSGLAEIAWQTGRAVRVGLQPEPGAVMDSVAQSAAALARVDRDRVGVCLDLSALACAWQDPAEALARLTEAGLSVIRVQLAAAIEVTDPTVAGDVLAGYLEEHTEHQVTTPAGGYAGDLADALRDRPSGPWRVRYPLPLHRVPPRPLSATTDVSRAALGYLMAGDIPSCEHLDVRTGPGDESAPDGAGETRVEEIAAELAYARDELGGLGLLPAGACAAR